jgi:hypothetical protein
MRGSGRAVGPRALPRPVQLKRVAPAGRSHLRLDCSQNRDLPLQGVGHAEGVALTSDCTHGMQ